jgi:hypothetical protein
MTSIHRISRLTRQAVPRLARCVVATVVAVIGFAAFAPEAFAMRIPAPGGSTADASVEPGSTVTHAVAASGLSVWVVAIIVVVVAALAAIIAVVTERAMAARRTGALPAA